jgi:hypothetical protein
MGTDASGNNQNPVNPFPLLERNTGGVTGE